VSFFNSKEEVIDIKLTQFGKNLLSRGYFKPVYYRFFDDDILYDSDYANFAEHQNDTEIRILENTPRLKTRHVSYPVEQSYLDEQEVADNTESDRRRHSLIFKEIKRDLDPLIQERLLLYPLHSKEIQNEKAPRIQVRTLDQRISGSITMLNLTSSGIIKNIPQITINPEYRIEENRMNLQPRKMVNQESYFDLSSREVVFADNSKINVLSKDIVIDIEEVNAFFGNDNFEIEVYEVIEVDGRDDDLRRIEDLEEVGKFFHIRTDEDIPGFTIESGRKKNYYRRGES
tara:strand:+ start:32783 stop:33643 length:861 start_codon:yes stop_codon:yes gene_type:complete